MAKKRKEIYGDLIYQYKPTIRSLLLEILQEKLVSIRRAKETPIREGAIFTPRADALGHLPLRYLALVERGRVVEMIRINEHTADWLLSEEVKLVPFDPKDVVVQKGMTYEDSKFFFDSDIPKENDDFVTIDSDYEKEAEDEEDKV
jgi:hypothetical protein